MLHSHGNSSSTNKLYILIIMTVSIVSRRFVQVQAFRVPLLKPFLRAPTPTTHNNNNGMARALFATQGGATSSNTDSTSQSSSATKILQPPPARREEDRVVVAGVAPPDWPKDVPRQSDYSPHQLLPSTGVPDPYGWMRDDARTNQEVLDHLKAENAFAEQLTQHLEPLRKTLYQEMLSSIQETDYTLPRPKRNYYLYARTFEGKSYNMYCRAPRKDTNDPTKDVLDHSIEWDGTAESPILPHEQIMLDVNELAKDKDYCAVGTVASSPSEQLLAYTVDFKGDEQCGLYVQNLETKQVVDHDPNLFMYGHVEWGKDDGTIFYLKLDDTLRPFQVYRRNIGDKDTDKQDELLFEEKDEMYFTSIGKTLDGKYLFIETSSTETSEVWYLDLEDPSATLQCIAKRRFKVLYDVEHRNGQWWITSNVEVTPNMRLFTAPAKANRETEWQLVVDPSTTKPLFDGGYERALHSVSTFSNHVVAEGREGGMPRVWILSMDTNSDNNNKLVKFDALEFPEAAHDVGLSSHFEFDIDKIVVAYDSLITPLQHLEISLDNAADAGALAERTVLKEKAVPGYDKELYDCDRIMVPSRDGKTEIPVNLVYRREDMEAHKAHGKPLHTHLYGYGSYGCVLLLLSSFWFPTGKVSLQVRDSFDSYLQHFNFIITGHAWRLPLVRHV